MLFQDELGQIEGESIRIVKFECGFSTDLFPIFILCPFNDQVEKTDPFVEGSEEG